VPDRPNRRAAIVEAALEVIGETGPGGFTQPRVAAQAGLRQSHLTYYYPTRDDLLVAVAEEAVRRRVALVREARDAGGPDEQIAALARVLTAPEHTRVLLALTQAADRNPAIREAFGALAAAVGPLGAALLTATGADADPAAVTLLQATSVGIAVLALARGEDVTELAEQLLATLVDRLARKDPS
jgi:AcrR family transcriptional regulator